MRFPQRRRSPRRRLEMLAWILVRAFTAPPISRIFFTKRRLSREAGIFISAAITDDCNSLDFDQHAGLREARDRNERTAGIVALPKCFFSDFDKSVPVAHVIDEYRHGDEVGEAAAGFLQGLIHR